MKQLLKNKIDDYLDYEKHLSLLVEDKVINDAVIFGILKKEDRNGSYKQK